MLPYVLSWISAFIIVIFTTSSIYTINIHPIPPFSGNILNDVGDFEDIVERDFINAENGVEKMKDLNQQHERCALHQAKNKTCNETDTINQAKRELHQVGKLFLQNYFNGDVEDSDENLRGLRQYDDDESSDEMMREQSQQETEQENALVANLTQEAKDLVEGNDEANKECCEEDEDEELMSEPKKDIGSPKNFLEMHLYKVSPGKSPNKKLVASLNKNKDSLTVNLYPKESETGVPQNYDYIALFANGQKLLQVPAVKFNLVSNSNGKYEKRTAHYLPFTKFRYKKDSLKNNLEGKQFNDLLKLIDSSKLRYENIARMPVLFINAVPSSIKSVPFLKDNLDKKAKIRKRDSSLSENKYLTEANSLIKSVDAELQTGASTPSVNAGILIYPKFEDLNFDLNKNPSTMSSLDSLSKESLNLLKPDSSLLETVSKDLSKNLINSAEIQNKDASLSSVLNPAETAQANSIDLSSAPKPLIDPSVTFKSINPKDIDLLLKSVISSTTAEPLPEDQISNIKVLNLIKNTESLKYTDPKLNFQGSKSEEEPPLVENCHNSVTGNAELNAANVSTVATVPTTTTEITTTTTTTTTTLSTTETTLTINCSLNESLAATFPTDINTTTLLPLEVASMDFVTNNSDTLVVTVTENEYAEDNNDTESLLDLLASMSTAPTNNTNTSTTETPSNTSIPTIGATEASQTPTAGKVEYVTEVAGATDKKSSILNKLQSLQKDLKLVFEVQNILSGSKKSENKSKRKKRNVEFHNYRKKRSCKKHKGDKIAEMRDAKMKEVAGLGKLLKYQVENESKNCKNNEKRFLSHSKKRKKKKRQRHRRKHWQKFSKFPLKRRAIHSRPRVKLEHKLRKRQDIEGEFDWGHDDVETEIHTSKGLHHEVDEDLLETTTREYVVTKKHHEPSKTIKFHKIHSSQHIKKISENEEPLEIEMGALGGNHETSTLCALCKDYVTEKESLEESSLKEVPADEDFAVFNENQQTSTLCPLCDSESSSFTTSHDTIGNNINKKPTRATTPKSFKHLHDITKMPKSKLKLKPTHSGYQSSRKGQHTSMMYPTSHHNGHPTLASTTTEKSKNYSATTGLTFTKGQVLSHHEGSTEPPTSKSTGLQHLSTLTSKYTKTTDEGNYFSNKTTEMLTTSHKIPTILQGNHSIQTESTTQEITTNTIETESSTVDIMVTSLEDLQDLEITKIEESLKELVTFLNTMDESLVSEQTTSEISSAKLASTERTTEISDAESKSSSTENVHTSQLDSSREKNAKTTLSYHDVSNTKILTEKLSEGEVSKNLENTASSAINISEKTVTPNLETENNTISYASENPEHENHIKPHTDKIENSSKFVKSHDEKDITLIEGKENISAITTETTHTINTESSESLTNERTTVTTEQIYIEEFTRAESDTTSERNSNNESTLLENNASTKTTETSELKATTSLDQYHEHKFKEDKSTSSETNNKMKIDNSGRNLSDKQYDQHTSEFSTEMTSITLAGITATTSEYAPLDKSTHIPYDELISSQEYPTTTYSLDEETKYTPSEQRETEQVAVTETSLKSTEREHSYTEETRFIEDMSTTLGERNISIQTSIPTKESDTTPSENVETENHSELSSHTRLGTEAYEKGNEFSKDIHSKSSTSSIEEYNMWTLYNDFEEVTQSSVNKEQSTTEGIYSASLFDQITETTASTSIEFEESKITLSDIGDKINTVPYSADKTTPNLHDGVETSKIGIEHEGHYNTKLPEVATVTTTNNFSINYETSSFESADQNSDYLSKNSDEHPNHNTLKEDHEMMDVTSSQAKNLASLEVSEEISTLPNSEERIHLDTPKSQALSSEKTFFEATTIAQDEHLETTRTHTEYMSATQEIESHATVASKKGNETKTTDKPDEEHKTVSEASTESHKELITQSESLTESEHRSHTTKSNNIEMTTMVHKEQSSEVIHELTASEEFEPKIFDTTVLSNEGISAAISTVTEVRHGKEEYENTSENLSKEYKSELETTKLPQDNEEKPVSVRSTLKPPESEMETTNLSNEGQGGHDVIEVSAKTTEVHIEEQTGQGNSEVSEFTEESESEELSEASESQYEDQNAEITLGASTISKAESMESVQITIGDEQFSPNEVTAFDQEAESEKVKESTPGELQVSETTDIDEASQESTSEELSGAKENQVGQNEEEILEQTSTQEVVMEQPDVTENEISGTEEYVSEESETLNKEEINEMTNVFNESRDELTSEGISEEISVQQNGEETIEQTSKEGFETESIQNTEINENEKNKSYEVSSTHKDIIDKVETSELPITETLLKQISGMTETTPEEQKGKKHEQTSPLEVKTTFMENTEVSNQHRNSEGDDQVSGTNKKITEKLEVDTSELVNEITNEFTETPGATTSEEITEIAELSTEQSSSGEFETESLKNTEISNEQDQNREGYEITKTHRESTEKLEIETSESPNERTNEFNESTEESETPQATTSEEITGITELSTEEQNEKSSSGEFETESLKNTEISNEVYQNSEGYEITETHRENTEKLEMETSESPNELTNEINESTEEYETPQATTSEEITELSTEQQNEQSSSGEFETESLKNTELSNEQDQNSEGYEITKTHRESTEKLEMESSESPNELTNEFNESTEQSETPEATTFEEITEFSTEQQNEQSSSGEFETESLKNTEISNEEDQNSEGYEITETHRENTEKLEMESSESPNELTNEFNESTEESKTPQATTSEEITGMAELSTEEQNEQSSSGELETVSLKNTEISNEEDQNSEGYEITETHKESTNKFNESTEESETPEAITSEEITGIAALSTEEQNEQSSSGEFETESLKNIEISNEEDQNSEGYEITETHRESTEKLEMETSKSPNEPTDEFNESIEESTPSEKIPIIEETSTEEEMGEEHNEQTSTKEFDTELLENTEISDKHRYDEGDQVSSLYTETTEKFEAESSEPTSEITHEFNEITEETMSEGISTEEANKQSSSDELENESLKNTELTYEENQNTKGYEVSKIYEETTSELPNKITNEFTEITEETVSGEISRITDISIEGQREEEHVEQTSPVELESELVETTETSNQNISSEHDQVIAIHKASTEKLEGETSESINENTNEATEETISEVISEPTELSSEEQSEEALKQYSSDEFGTQSSKNTKINEENQNGESFEISETYKETTEKLETDTSESLNEITNEYNEATLKTISEELSEISSEEHNEQSSQVGLETESLKNTEISIVHQTSEGIGEVREGSTLLQEATNEIGESDETNQQSSLDNLVTVSLGTTELSEIDQAGEILINTNGSTAETTGKFESEVSATTQIPNKGTFEFSGTGEYTSEELLNTTELSSEKQTGETELIDHTDETTEIIEEITQHKDLSAGTKSSGDVSSEVYIKEHGANEVSEINRATTEISVTPLESEHFSTSQIEEYIHNITEPSTEGFEPFTDRKTNTVETETARLSSSVESRETVETTKTIEYYTDLVKTSTESTTNQHFETSYQEKEETEFESVTPLNHINKSQTLSSEKQDEETTEGETSERSSSLSVEETEAEIVESENESTLDYISSVINQEEGMDFITGESENVSPLPSTIEDEFNTSIIIESIEDFEHNLYTKGMENFSSATEPLIELTDFPETPNSESGMSEESTDNMENEKEEEEQQSEAIEKISESLTTTKSYEQQSLDDLVIGFSKQVTSLLTEESEYEDETTTELLSENTFIIQDQQITEFGLNMSESTPSVEISSESIVATTENKEEIETNDELESTEETKIISTAIKNHETPSEATAKTTKHNLGVTHYTLGQTPTEKLENEQGDIEIETSTPNVASKVPETSTPENKVEIETNGELEETEIISTTLRSHETQTETYFETTKPNLIVTHYTLGQTPTEKIENEEGDFETEKSTPNAASKVPERTTPGNKVEIETNNELETSEETEIISTTLISLETQTETYLETTWPNQEVTHYTLGQTPTEKIENEEGDVETEGTTPNAASKVPERATPGNKVEIETNNELETTEETEITSSTLLSLETQTETYLETIKPNQEVTHYMHGQTTTKKIENEENGFETENAASKVTETSSHEFQEGSTSFPTEGSELPEMNFQFSSEIVCDEISCITTENTTPTTKHFQTETSPKVLTTKRHEPPHLLENATSTGRPNTMNINDMTIFLEEVTEETSSVPTTTSHIKVLNHSVITSTENNQLLTGIGEFENVSLIFLSEAIESSTENTGLTSELSLSSTTDSTEYPNIHNLLTSTITTSEDKIVSASFINEPKTETPVESTHYFVNASDFENVTEKYSAHSVSYDIGAKTTPHSNESELEILKKIFEPVSTSTESEENIFTHDEEISRKPLNRSTAVQFSTTLMLILSSTLANATSAATTEEITTIPSIYVDLPIFLPNETFNIPELSELEPGAEHADKFYNGTESLILFINGPNDDVIKKLNGSKWYRRFNQSSVTTISSDISTLSLTTSTSETITKESHPVSSNFMECTKSDFENNKNCFCSVDSLVNSIKLDGSENETHVNCLNFLKVDNGLIIGNESKAEVRKKRSYYFGKSSLPFKREIIDYRKGFFDERFKVSNTDSRIYALPGTKVIIPCLNRNEVVEYNRYMNYIWSFEDNANIPNNQIQEDEGNLIINNVVPKDSGNYTCSVKSRLNEKSNVVQKHFHHLIVVATPIYKIITNLLYQLNQPCDLIDGDVLSMYLPKILSGLLCGYNERICRIEVPRPKCINKHGEHLINVTFIVTMFELKQIVPNINNEKCQINCQLELYSSMASVLLKNMEIFSKIPVAARLSMKNNDFRPKEIASSSKTKGLFSSAPVLMITCPAGFGIEKRQPKICIACPQNTYSVGHESYCKTCPAGQYQPVAGSKSCILCSSPLENRACLRVLYSDAKYFKIYVGVAFGVVLLLILMIVYCTTSPTTESLTYISHSNDYTQNLRKRNRDLEHGDTMPLLRNEHRYLPRTNNIPPQPPPPDFY